MNAMRSSENGRKCTRAKNAIESGKKNDPIEISFPRYLMYPNDAIASAPKSEPTPRAENKRPFVAASPFRIFTDHAGSNVPKDIPNRLVVATNMMSARIVG